MFKSTRAKKKRSDASKKEEASSTIKPFAVCADVQLGPLLPVQSNDGIRETWEKVEKNKSSSDPTKTTKDNRFSQQWNPQAEPEKWSMLEAMSKFEEKEESNLVFYDFNSVNLLAKAVHVSFYQHYPLRLSPDVIWLTILQGLAKHIDKDPEGQRHNFVNFDGKKKLIVVRPDFVKGSPENDWTNVFPEFASTIASEIGTEKATAMTCDFSTSTPTDRICSHIALMDTVKHYFEYMMMCGCGIPSIELLGTTADWVALRAKAEMLCEFDDLEWWRSELFPVLDHFVQAAKGSPDIKFWKSICNLYGASGLWSSYVTGWIQVFFPYLTSGNRQNGIGQWREHYENGTGYETEEYNRGNRPDRFGAGKGIGYGLKLDYIPVGVSQAPFTYKDLATSQTYEMTFNGGIVAIVQNTKTKAIEPVTGWAVLDHSDSTMTTTTTTNVSDS